jgi:hypothetical protein
MALLALLALFFKKKGTKKKTSVYFLLKKKKVRAPNPKTNAKSAKSGQKKVLRGMQLTGGTKKNLPQKCQKRMPKEMPKKTFLAISTPPFCAVGRDFVFHVYCQLLFPGG